MKKISKNIGCRGRRLKILPEKSDILADESIVQKAKVLEVGPDCVCKKGDTIIFSMDGYDKAVIGDETFHYVIDTDQFIFEIIK